MASRIGARRARAVLLAVAATFTALLAARQASVLALRAKAPALALRIDPKNPVALANVFFRTAYTKDGQIAPASPRWIAAAREALRTEPLSDPALLILAGTGAQDVAQREHDRQLMRTASSITRRNLSVELWQIEDAALRQDIAGAMVHYDRALSVHPDAGPFLFPVLTGAVSDTSIRQALTPYLARNRMWISGFLGYFAAKTEDYPAALDLLRRYGGSHRVATHRAHETVLLKRLVGSGNDAMARDLGRWMTGFDIASPARFGLSAATMDETLQPLAWHGDTDGVVTTDFDPHDGLTIRVPAAEQGIALSRVIILSAGRWMLRQTLEWRTATPVAELSWTVTCLTRTSREKIADIEPSSHIGRHSYTDSFVVPSSCSAVQFDLFARGSLNDGDAEAVLRSIALSPTAT